MQSLHQFIYMLERAGFTKESEEMKTVLSFLDELIGEAKSAVKTEMKKNIDADNFDANIELNALYHDATRLQESANVVYTPPAIAAVDELPVNEENDSKRPRKIAPMAVFINNREYDLPKNTWRACVQVVNDVLSSHNPGAFKAYAAMVNAEKLKTLFYATNQHKGDASWHYLPSVHMYLNTLLDADGTVVRLKQMTAYFNVSIMLKLVNGETIDLSHQQLTVSQRIIKGCTVQHPTFGTGQCVEIKHTETADMCVMQFGKEQKQFLLEDGQCKHLTVINEADAKNVIPDGLYYAVSEFSGANATLEVKDGRLFLKAGSILSYRMSPNEKSGLINARNAIPIDEQRRVLQDTEMSSISYAAGVVMGASTNGWERWKNAQGQPVDIYRK